MRIARGFRPSLRAWAALAMGATIAASGCDKNPSAPKPPSIHRTLRVEVTDSLGAPAESVVVRLVSERDSAGLARIVTGTTDAQGALIAVLIEGPWGVHGRRLGTRRVAGATFDVPGRTRPEVDTIVVRVALHTASSAHGRVLLGGHTDHSGVVVDCPPVLTVQTTDMTGAYVMDLLPLGHWTITMFKTGFSFGLAPIDVQTPGQSIDVPDVLLISNPLPDGPS